MTLPPRLSELLDESMQKTAVNDTANDELYMGENIGPIVTGDTSDENPEGVLASSKTVIGPPNNCQNCGYDHDVYELNGVHDGWLFGYHSCPRCGNSGAEVKLGLDTRWVPSQAFSSTSLRFTADVLPGPEPTQGDVNEDMSGAMNQDQPDLSGMAPSATQPVSTLGTPSMASSWTAEDYISTIQKKASDSDVYSRGYSDAISGKEMDEGMANLSMDYYQGYKQGLLYNEDNLTSAPASIQDIQSKTHYEMQKSAPNPPRGDTFPK